MECILSIVPCLLESSADSAAKQAAYIRDLEDNHRSLVTEIGKLKCRRDDLSNRVEEAEKNRMERTREVNDWLERVKAVEEKVDEILPKVTRELEKRCLGSCCPKNCKSSYKLGKEVTEMIPQVKSLMEEGTFDVFAHELPPPPVIELRIDDAVVGFESKLKKVWRHVQSKDAAIIGLVGMGGVGKTTLLMQLNNKFLEATDEYDVVIWAVVSQPVNLGNIQASFKSRLNIPDNLWDGKGEGERATLIYEKLQQKKFVVLLDDMWERLDLSKVGIPQPNKDNMSKVVLTTRSQQVCNSMKAQMIDVSCLPPNRAFNLFRSIVGEEMLKCHPELMGLVQDVARECKGLPLALTVIGRSMIGITDAQDWKDAKRMLEKYPSDMVEVKGEVFSKLLFSYDHLPTLAIKKCFEYCSLYPEDHNISKSVVIKLWIAERLIDAYDSMYDALVQGRQIMKCLVQAGLLEAGGREGTVRMHDMIRDMSLWLACERGKKMSKIWVDVLNDVTDATHNAMAESGSNIEKASLWGPGTTVESLAWLSLSSNLGTLIVRDTKLVELPGEIFRSMKVLKVLDLSLNERLRSLPREISGLTSLEYLNIMKTDVIRLPIEIEQLKKLRFLMVAKRTVIPKTVISSLRLLLTLEQQKPAASALRVLLGTPGEISFKRGMAHDRISMEKEMLEELEGHEHIMHLSLLFTTTAGLQKLSGSPKLQSCVGQLCSLAVDSLPDELDLGLTKNLEKLHLASCDTRVIKFRSSTSYSNMSKVSLQRCNKIRNLNSLVYVPSLSILKLESCKSMEELIGEETNEGISLFSCLTQLHLRGLPMLRRICPQSALPFPSLKFMGVIGCKSLRKLPLDSNTANTTPPELKIEGDNKEWWDGLEWDSQATKDAFTPKFVPYWFGRRTNWLRTQPKMRTNRLRTHNARRLIDEIRK